MELMKGDSPKVSDDTPMYNPQRLPLNIILCIERLFNVWENSHALCKENIKFSTIDMFLIYFWIERKIIRFHL